MAKKQVVRYIRKSDSGRSAYKQRERIIQRALTRWLSTNHPDIDFYNDWAAGAYLTHGQNNARLSMTSRNGWVDLFIPEPRGRYHGLFIELKREDARVFLKDGVTLCSDLQIQKEGAFLQRQADKGYAAWFAIGELEAKRIISEYFGWPHDFENLELF